MQTAISNHVAGTEVLHLDRICSSLFTTTHVVAKSNIQQFMYFVQYNKQNEQDALKKWQMHVYVGFYWSDSWSFRKETWIIALNGGFVEQFLISCRLQVLTIVAVMFLCVCVCVCVCVMHTLRRIKKLFHFLWTALYCVGLAQG